MLEALEQASAHLAVQAVAGLSAEEQGQLLALLQRVRQNLAAPKG